MAFFLRQSSRQVLSSYGKPNRLFLRNRSFIRKKLVTREECLRISRCAMADYDSTLRRLNLSEQHHNFEGADAELQILRNESTKFHSMYVRPSNSFPYYYRVELIMQRIQFMSSMGMTPREKFIALKKKPPVMVVCNKQLFEGTGMVYLRGILKEGSLQKYFFHPVFPRMSIKKSRLEERLDDIGKQMEITRERVLEAAMSVPCFTISTNMFNKYSDSIVCLHRKILPKKFDVDSHTFKVYPPVFSGFMGLSKKGETEISSLVGYELSDLLDTTYQAYNGNGFPEDFTEFIIRSYQEELHYNAPANFKKKRIPRKHKRFYTENVPSNFIVP